MKNILKKFKEASDEAFGNVITDISESEFLSRITDRLFETKEFIDKQQEVLLSAINIASNNKALELAEKMDAQKRKLNRMEKKVEKLVELAEDLSVKVDKIAKNFLTLESQLRQPKAETESAETTSKNIIDEKKSKSSSLKKKNSENWSSS